MTATRDRLPGLGLPLTDTFWLLRDFFSLACAVSRSRTSRAARVYHAHTTGYASLIGGRRGPAERREVPADRAQPVRARHHQHFTGPAACPSRSGLARVRGDHRADGPGWPGGSRWAGSCYPSADRDHLSLPGGDHRGSRPRVAVEKSAIVPNGMHRRRVRRGLHQRQRGAGGHPPAQHGKWRLAYIARRRAHQGPTRPDLDRPHSC